MNAAATRPRRRTGRELDVLFAGYAACGPLTGAHLGALSGQRLQTGVLDPGPADPESSAALQDALDISASGGHVHRVDPHARTHVGTLFVLSPARLLVSPDRFRKIVAQRVVILWDIAAVPSWEDRAVRVRFADAVAGRLFGVRPIWLPICPSSRRFLVENHLPVAMAPVNWCPVMHPDETVAAGRVPGQPAVFGFGPDAIDSPSAAEFRLQRALSSDGRFKVVGMSQDTRSSRLGQRLGRVFGRTPLMHPPASIAVGGPGDGERFLQKVDFAAAFPADVGRLCNCDWLHRALARGTVVFMPAEASAYFGAGSLCCGEEAVVQMAVDLLAGPERYRLQSAAAVRFIREAHGADPFLRMVQRLADS